MEQDVPLGPSSTRPRRIAAIAGVVAILLISIGAVIVAKHARGPYWLGYNNDPEYGYLLNSLNCATFHSPNLHDHPGTPVMVLGGAVLRIVHALNTTGISIDQDVISRPETFLAAYYYVLALICCAALCFLVHRLSGSAMAPLFAAGTLFASPALVMAMTRVNPEPMLIAAVIAIEIILAGMLFRKTPPEHAAWWFALIAGFGVAVKVTFLPLCIIPFVVLTGWKRHGVYAAGTILSFVVFTLPIAGHYRALARWFLNIITHTGRYGYGESGVVVPGKFVRTLLEIPVQEPLLVLSIVAGAALVGITLIRTGVRGFDPLAARVVAGCTLAQIAQIIMVAKHPGDGRYLVPALALVAFNFYSIAMLARGLWPARSFAKAGAAALFAILCCGVIRFPTAIADLAAKNRDVSKVAAFARATNDHARVYGYGASSVAYALSFGSGQTALRYGRLCSKVYGRNFFYDIWCGTYQTFEGPVSAEELLRKTGGRYVYQGYSFETVVPGLGGSRPQGTVEKIRELGGEALYRIVSAPYTRK